VALRGARDNTSWYVMPLVEPLEAYLAANRGIEHVVRAAAAVADVLARLAEQRVSHRDIKPSNLYWDRDHVVVGDFGLLTAPSHDEILTQGEPIGSRHFLSPEMHQPRPDLDYRPSDVYSLAKTTWCLASGVNVPPSHDLRIDSGNRLSLYVSPHPKLPSLELLLERATAEDPAQRPAMGEFARELRAWLMPETARSRTDDLSEYAARLAESDQRANRQDERRLLRVAAAQRAHGRIISLLTPLELDYQQMGFANVSFERDNPSVVTMQTNVPNSSPNLLMRLGSSVTIRTAGPGGSELLCGLGLQVLRTGDTEYYAACAINDWATRSVDGTGSFALEWWDSRVAPLESELERIALNELLGALKAQLPVVLPKFTEPANQRWDLTEAENLEVREGYLCTYELVEGENAGKQFLVLGNSRGVEVNQVVEANVPPPRAFPGIGSVDRQRVRLVEAKPFSGILPIGGYYYEQGFLLGGRLEYGAVFEIVRQPGEGVNKTRFIYPP
jgi:hypothetical protein